VELFAQVFGLEKVQTLEHEYPVDDFYGTGHFVDYALRMAGVKIAFEIDGGGLTGCGRDGPRRVFVWRSATLIVLTPWRRRDQSLSLSRNWSLTQSTAGTGPRGARHCQPRRPSGRGELVPTAAVITRSRIHPRDRCYGFIQR
jgi:hypothetical protein